ncbi:MAG: cbb3-type cytochrome c oxidase subunit I [Planctomycetes bacterium]|nr:cbb3-type cytochrome c oxidase subunit I [Planctomycetota bacterium]
MTAPSSLLRRRVFSTDHKVIGVQFLLFSAFFLVLGGLTALAIRWQLAWPWSRVPIVGKALYPATGGVMTPEGYTVLFTLHGTIMIFFVIIPLLVGAFGNFLIPLMIGARDMAFPRLNAASFWLMVPAGALIVASFFVASGGPASGWTAYPPLAPIASAAAGRGLGQTLWLVSVFLAGVASTLGALNYVATVVMLRARGLSWTRLPLTVWALFFSAIIQLVALPVLTAGAVLQLFDRFLGTGFYTPAHLVVNQFTPESAGHAVGGQPLLWQHLFWFYSHPAVYVMVLPAMGIVSDVLAVHGRKPVFGYRPMVFSMGTIVVLGMFVWGHHMFVSGLDPAAGTAFMLSTILIALPSSVKVFNWLATLWGSRPRYDAAFLNAVGFVAMFVIGGLSGIWLASTPVDVPLHDTALVVGHFHFVVFGGSVFAAFAALHHWFPKMTGRRLDERLGKLHFAGTFVLTACVFLMMHQLGMAGQPRRVADPYVYAGLAHLKPLNVFISKSAFLLAAWQGFLVVNVVKTLLAKPEGERNPWDANTLEWETASPPPHANFEAELVVARGPYEYGVPDGPRDHRRQVGPG